MREFAPRLAWSDFVHELADTLRELRPNAGIYLVGGAVRDAYLRRPSLDYDIVAQGGAIALARRLTDRLSADIYIMDRERGVARVFVSQGDQQLTVDFADQRGGTLEADLRDRDFTMNAMAADISGDIGALIDPLGGAADLRAKILRRCSPDSIKHDAIRGMRAIRLSVQFDLKIHPATAADVRHHARDLGSASPERVRDEFFKLLGLSRAARGLRVMRHLGLLEVVLPTLPADDSSLRFAAVERLTTLLTAISQRRTDNTAAAFDLGMLVIQLDRFRASLQAHIAQTYGNGRNHGQLLALAALLQGMDTTPAAESLRLSADESRLLAVAAGGCRRIRLGSCWTRIERHRFWHQLEASGIDAILLGAANALAGQGASLRQDDWLALVEQLTQLLDGYFNDYEGLVKPRLLLNGRAVMRLLDIKAGPQIGAALTALREAQVSGAVTTVEQARAFVREKRTPLGPPVESGGA